MACALNLTSNRQSAHFATQPPKSPESIRTDRPRGSEVQLRGGGRPTLEMRETYIFLVRWLSMFHMVALYGHI